MKEIDLAYKNGPECCAPTPCCGNSKCEPSYPGVYLTFPEDSELPDSGEITFKFRIRRETEEKQGEKCCKYDLDLMSVVGVKGDKVEVDDEESDSAAIRIEKAFKGKK